MQGNELGELRVLECAELEGKPETRAAHAVGKTADARRRRDLIRPVRPEDEESSVGEVVREEDDEIERRDVGPVQILEHEQDRPRFGVLGERPERRLEHLELRACGPRLQRGSERMKCLDERLVGQLCPDEVDRAAEKDVEPGVARASCELGGKACLSDPGLSGDEDGRTAPCSGCVERSLERVELACASDKRLARASLHSGQYRAGFVTGGRR